MDAFVAGIDPGKTGGVVLLDRQGQVIDKTPMPDSFELSKYLADWRPHHVFLEKAQSMPGQGVTSVFNYADHFGQLQGILIALKLRFQLVSPRIWQKTVLTGVPIGYQPKQRAAIAAKRLFPGLSLLASSRSTKPHEGMVDALLIALYGYRTLSEPAA
jgi:crossover junction endodeoxyribonuclease RuvC